MAKAKLQQEFQQAHHSFSNPSDASWTSVSGSSTSGNSVASGPHFTFTPLPMAVDPPAKKHTFSPNFLSEESCSESLATDPSNAAHPTANSKPNVSLNLQVLTLFDLMLMQGISILLSHMVSRMSSFMNALFKREADDNLNTKCACKRLLRTSGCNDCLQFGLVCDLCFIEAHTTNPTHWVHRWNGEYFTKLDMSELGHVITLGHGGLPCPSVEYHTSCNLSHFTLVDANGVHQTSIAYCKCPTGGDHVDQLLGAQIFPATVDQPATGFTFTLLRLFHLICLHSKKSAYDFCEALRHLTNNAFPDTVPVR